MRIFQLAPVFGTAGGTETYAAWLSERLTSMGHQTAMAAAAVHAARPNNYEVTELPELAWRDVADPVAGRRRIREAVRDFRPDCVLVHGVGDGPLLRMLQADYLTVEFVHSFSCRGQKLFRRADKTCKHPLGPRCLIDWYLGPCGTDPSPRIALASLREARDHIEALASIDLVIVGSSFMKRYLMGEGLGADHIQIVDMTMGLAETETPARSRESGTHLIFVGRTVYVKGIQYLIRALGLLDREYDLTIVGDGWYLAPLKDLTERLGLGGRVTFRGGLQGADLVRACRFADVAVVPSIYPEPSGLVVPELRSLGIPVVVTDAGGLSEWATRYSSIHIADAANPASLAAAIRNAARGRHGSAPGRTVPPDDLLSLIEGLHTARMQEGGVALGV